jgi:hypothetical protein
MLTYIYVISKNYFLKFIFNKLTILKIIFLQFLEKLSIVHNNNFFTKFSFINIPPDALLIVFCKLIFKKNSPKN